MKWLFILYAVFILCLIEFMMINIDDHVTWLEDRLSNQCLLADRD
jgi:hypothetical protein